jgi:hypothetical protein
MKINKQVNIKYTLELNESQMKTLAGLVILGEKQLKSYTLSSYPVFEFDFLKESSFFNKNIENTSLQRFRLHIDSANEMINHLVEKL